MNFDPGSESDSDEEFEEVRKSIEKRNNLREKYEQREYQTYLFQEAIKDNIIICLPTGCGKTFIAVKLVQHYLNDSIKSNKKIIFVATTVPLVHQQGRYLKDHLGMEFDTKNNTVGIVTGDMRPEDWDGSKWKAILEKHAVFAMTDQILRQAVERAHIKWEAVSLLILDECHNATKNHPMSQLMGSYRDAYKQGKVIGETLPRVLGLSATIIIGNADVNKIKQEIKEIQENFLCRAITYENYGEVIKCATAANIKISTFNSVRSWVGVDEEKGFKFDLEEMINEIMSSLKLMRPFVIAKNKFNFDLAPGLRDDRQLFLKSKDDITVYIKEISDIKDTLQEMGPYCARNAVLMKIAYFKYLSYKEKKKCSNYSSTKKTLKRPILHWIQEQLEFLDQQLMMFMFYGSPRQADENFCATQFVSPKMKALTDILYSQRPLETADNDICGIIFCQKRITAQMVCYYLQDLASNAPEKFGFLKCSFVLGTSGSSNNGPVQAIALRKQAEVLDSFHQKRFNILVATKVLEEGLDVPSCNFICRYDPILTYPSFVQSMGRARQKGAKFFALVEVEDREKEENRIHKFETFKSALTDTLIKNVDLTESYYDTENINETELNILVPPFKPTLDGPQITAGSATQIVYSYCEQLNNDKLSTLSPISWWVPIESKFKVCVQLPPNACVKYAESLEYINKTVAKKAAFLEVCKKLYAAGVLYNETLLPIPRDIPSHLNDFFRVLESVSATQETKDAKKMGSKNRVQWYPKKVPFEFEMNPFNLETLTVYSIQIQLQNDAYFSTEEIKPLLNFEHHEYCFGILTAADLSKVPDFLLFSRDGNFRVHLEKVTLSNKMSDSILKKVQAFNRLTFSQDSELLKLAHPIFQDCDSDYLYIVPLRKLATKTSLELALDIMEKLEDGQNVKYNHSISMAERREMIINKETLHNALVIPYYSLDRNERQKYCVLAVQTDRNPLSEFDNPVKAKNYVQYYEQQHKITIVQLQQPLLRAKAISPRLNYLLGDYNTGTMSREERRNAKYTQSVVSLVPELTRQHPLPGILFVQLKMLPSCLHRISRLLLADEIGESVSAFSHKKGQNNVGQRLEKDLQTLNYDIKAKATVMLNTSEIVTQPVMQIINPISNVSRPDQYDNDQQMNMFTLKRKMYWVEIEYIHPKKILPEHLNDPDSSDEDEMDIIPPDSPPASARMGIKLIPSADIPSEHFDTVKVEPELPLVTTIMEAMTLANARDRMSLEKLEMIGDSVLKLIVTLHIYCNFPEFSEGQLTQLRTKLISNRHLFIAGEKKNLGEYLAGSLFEPESAWRPPGLQIPKRLEKIAVENRVNYSVYSRLSAAEAVDFTCLEDEVIHDIVQQRIRNNTDELQALGPTHTSYTHSRIGNKSVADCVEALIGAYYLSGSLHGALYFMEWMGLRGPNNEKPAKEVPYSPIHKLPSANTQYPKEVQNFITLKDINALERLLDYKFKNHWLLVEAFTHPSYLKNNATNAYQRLEYLGDAVLDFLVTNHIYKNDTTGKKMSPGLLTDLRSSLVNNVTFGSLTVRYGFHKLLMHFSPKLQQLMDQFANCQERNNHQVLGAFKYITDQDCVIAEDIEVPKALGDIFESLAGAVFIDSGMSLDTTWAVFYRLMKNEIDLFSSNLPKQPIRELYELFPGGVKFRTDFDEKSGRYLAILKIVHRRKVLGSGLTKKSAKNAAAKFALKTLRDENRLQRLLNSN